MRFFVLTSAGAVSSGMLFRSDHTSVFQRSRLSFILANRYFRLLFSRFASLHFALHLSRLRQKNRSNLEIGLRNGNDSPIDIGPPPCNVPTNTRPQHKTTINGTKTGKQRQITFSPRIQLLSPAHTGLVRLASEHVGPDDPHEGLAGDPASRRRERTAGLRVHSVAGVVGASPPCRSTGVAADSSLAGTGARGEVLHLQRCPDVPLETMALVTGSRWPVEEFFEDAKGKLGIAHYEARSWTSWHHHMSLVALAHLYVMQVRRDLKRKTPGFTLDMAMRLLQAVCAVSQ